MPTSKQAPRHASSGASSQVAVGSVSPDPIVAVAAEARTTPTTSPVPSDQLGSYKLGVMLALIGWLALFGGGLTISSAPYRDHLGTMSSMLMGDVAGAGSGLVSYAGAFLMTLLFYTPTNVALLCILAGFLGASGAVANLSVGPKTSADGVNPYVSGVLRGAFVFLLVTSGLLVLTEAPFANASPENYVRMAGFLSLLSFVVSYNPHIFAALLDRVDGRVTRGSERVARVSGAVVAAPGQVEADGPAPQVPDPADRNGARD